MEEDIMDIDRRTAIAVGLTGASAASALLLGVRPSLAATETQGEEIAPGVRYLLLGEVQSPIEEFVKVSWEEITWQPGAKLGPETMKNPMMCEIMAGELQSTRGASGRAHGGNAQLMPVKAGYTFACKAGMVENNENKGTEVAVMRRVNLLPA
jgi:hypothetical protein